MFFVSNYLKITPYTQITPSPNGFPGLMDEKEGAMINMMTRAGKHRPGLVLLDHRLNLGEKGLPYATTYLQPLVGLVKDKPNQKAGKAAPVPLLTYGQRVYFRQ